MGSDYDEKGDLIIPVGIHKKVKILKMKQPENKNLEKMPNQKWHQIISFIKSAIRIIGYLFIPFDLLTAAIILVISEIIGIVEELV